MAEEQQQFAYVSFSAEVNANTAEGLLGVCADLANKGTKKVCLLLSTPGGSVMHGVNIYNVLRGLPFELTTHNVSSVNSIGNVIFLAGDRRYAVPSSTFMFHGVGIDAKDGMRLEERFLRERLDSIEADHNRIASIIGDRATFPENENIADLFLQEATKDTGYAMARGIIHEVRDVQVPSGVPVLQLVFKR